jgi:hypothetical protein
LGDQLEHLAFGSGTAGRRLPQCAVDRVALIVPPVIAVILAFSLAKVYQADAKLLIKPGREFMPTANMGQNEYALPNSTMAEIVKSEVEILNSKDLAESTLKTISVAALYPDLATLPEKQALERAVTIFEAQLQVDAIDLSTVVNVGFQSEDPEIAAKVLTVLLADFQARHVNVYSGGLIEPIQEQIASKQKELEALDAKRIAYQNKTGAFSIPEQRASLITQRAAVQTLLHDAEIKEGALEQQVAFLKKSKANTPKMSALESESDPTSQTSSEALAAADGAPSEGAGDGAALPAERARDGSDQSADRPGRAIRQTGAVAELEPRPGPARNRCWRRSSSSCSPQSLSSRRSPRRSRATRARSPISTISCSSFRGASSRSTISSARSSA